MQKTSQQMLAGAAIVFGLMITFAIFQYNGLVGGEENVRSKWAEVEVQYQRRMDLIPNIVATIKGETAAELKIKEALLNARNSWAHATSSGDIEAKMSAGMSMDRALPAFLSMRESAFPTAQSLGGFKDLRIELEGTENRIAVARRDFNEAVRGFNVKVRRFPGNVFARNMGFKTWKSFESDVAAATAPAVKF